jgi:hypothetical protein
MGESHCGDAADARPTITQDVVRHLGLGGYLYFDTILSAVADKDVEALDRSCDGAQLAYSNFVQDVLPDDDRRPDYTHWLRAREAFFGQLAIARPRQLLVVGKQIWENFSDAHYVRLDPFISPWSEKLVEDVLLYAYEVGDRVEFTLATWIYHPSSRGLLNLQAARERVRAVTAVTCNVFSSVQRDGNGYFVES